MYKIHILSLASKRKRQVTGRFTERPLSVGSQCRTCVKFTFLAPRMGRWPLDFWEKFCASASEHYNLLKPNDIYIYIYVVPQRQPPDAAF